MKFLTILPNKSCQIYMYSLDGRLWFELQIGLMWDSRWLLFAWMKNETGFLGNPLSEEEKVFCWFLCFLQRFSCNEMISFECHSRLCITRIERTLWRLSSANFLCFLDFMTHYKERCSKVCLEKKSSQCLLQNFHFFCLQIIQKVTFCVQENCPSLDFGLIFFLLSLVWIKKRSCQQVCIP